MLDSINDEGTRPMALTEYEIRKWLAQNTKPLLIGEEPYITSRECSCGCGIMLTNDNHTVFIDRVSVTEREENPCVTDCFCHTLPDTVMETYFEDYTVPKNAEDLLTYEELMEWGDGRFKRVPTVWACTCGNLFMFPVLPDGQIIIDRYVPTAGVDLVEHEEKPCDCNNLPLTVSVPKDGMWKVTFSRHVDNNGLKYL